MLQLLREDADAFLSRLWHWDLVLWCVATAAFVLRFIAIATLVAKKYSNLSILITEQVLSPRSSLASFASSRMRWCFGGEKNDEL